MPASTYIMLSPLLLACLSGCATNGQPQASTNERAMTLGVVQKEIRAGMSQGDVATVLGSPNMVTKDSSGKETWIYDKMASEASYSKKSGYATLLLLGGASESASARSTQKTLTVVIKFNNQQQVESVNYNSTTF